MNKKTLNIGVSNKKSTLAHSKKSVTISPKKSTLTSPKKAVTTSTKKLATVKKGVSAKHVIQYVLPLGNGWIVKNSKAANFILITDSKREAISLARTLARTKHTQLIVHGKSGNVEVMESYAI